MVEQFGCRQHDGRISELVKAVEEELGVFIALNRGAGEPLPGLLPILFHIPAQEIQLSQSVLGERISLPGSGGQIFQHLCRILPHGLAGEIELSQAVLSKRISVPSSLVQPAHCLPGALLGEEQFSESVF